MADSRIDIGTLERRAIYTSSASQVAKITGLDIDVTIEFNADGEVVIREKRFRDDDPNS